MDDAVRAEVSAVASLKSGIERFAVHVATALDDAKAQVRAAQEKAHRTLEQRRNRYEQTSRVLAQAEAVLARCPPEARASAAHAVAQARSSNQKAKALLDKARGALATIDRAAGELLKSLSSAQAQLDTHAGSGKTYLAELDAQLRRITAGGSHVRTVLETVGMVGEAVVGALGVDAALIVAEKAGHLPDGILHEAGGLFHDGLDTLRSVPLDEGDGSIEIGGH